jgi:thioredoxin reductase (NADPH)
LRPLPLHAIVWRLFNHMEHRNIIIIGGACAGYTAAIYTSRARLEPLIFTGSEPGGQLMLTSVVENFPGFPEGIDGPDLMSNMRKQAEKFGSTIKDIKVDSVDFSKKPYTVTAGDATYTSDTIIVASGASAKWLDIKGEKERIGKGVSSCATCDAAFFKEKEVAVVGAGDAAMEDILALTKFASKVNVLIRRDEMRASKIMQERVLAEKKVNIMWNTVVEEVFGEPIVAGIKIKNTKTNEITDLTIQGLFVAIGHIPNTNFLKGAITTDELGYIISKTGTTTNVEGVFVAGDVSDHKYRQAALDAERYIEGL